MGVLANEDDYDVTLAYGVSCFVLPGLVRIRFIERTVANAMVGLLLGLPVKLVLQVLVFVELETHEDIENGHSFSSPELGPVNTICRAVW